MGRNGNNALRLGRRDGTNRAIAAVATCSPVLCPFPMITHAHPLRVACTALTALTVSAAACLTLMTTARAASVPAAAANAPIAHSADPLTAPLPVQMFTLDNGLQLFVQPDHRAPTAVHMLWVRVGSMDEVDGISGVAHMLEHMMFKGSATMGPGEFSRRVAQLGGRENAFTSLDYTGYFQQVGAQQLPKVMALEAERFSTNQWADEEFTREMAVVQEERRMRTEDNPRAMLHEQLSATMFTASPYRRPIVGWMGDLQSMTAQDVRDFYRQWYTPGNAAVVVVGDVQPQQVLQWAQSTYGRIPARAVPERKPRSEPQQLGERRITVRQRASQAYVSLAWHVPALTNVHQPTARDQDALALLMLSAVLDGHAGARLPRALVRGEGGDGQPRVADAAGSSANVLARGPGVFMLTGVPARGHTAAEVEAALRGQIARIARDGVQPHELDRVRTQWWASKVYERDSVMGQAFALGTQWVLGLPPDTQDRLFAHLTAVTPEQVQSVAARYFGDDTLNSATLMPLAASAQAPAGTAAR